MFLQPLILLCAGALTATATRPEKPVYALEEAESLFEDFIKTHNKHYVDEVEKKMRFEIFKYHLEDINRMNANPNETAIFGITKFSDLTEEEFINQHTGFILPEEADSPAINITEPKLKSVDMYDSFDWRTMGVVTEVKNQQNCRSCWAFATTGVVEGAYALKHRQLREFSEQQLVDCDTNNSGCNGGYISNALNYLMQVGGITGEASYPYYGTTGRCRFDHQAVEARVVQYIPVNSYSEEYLRQQLHHYGPIGIIVDATSFTKYYGGVMSHCTYNKLNHAVLLVGYGTENGVPYWTIKNSYGTAFGEQGYIRVRRGVNACGLLNYHASAAIVA